MAQEGTTEVERSLIAGRIRMWHLPVGKREGKWTRHG
jgi:hypothetical protein